MPCQSPKSERVLQAQKKSPCSQAKQGLQHDQADQLADVSPPRWIATRAG